MHAFTPPGPGLQHPAQPWEQFLAREDTTHGKYAGCKARILAGKLPSVPVGQGETGPSYPGRYKAHRCKCREHLRLPPLSGSTHLPAGSSQNTAAVSKRELTYPTPTTAYYSPFGEAPRLCPGRLSCPWTMPNSIPSIQAISSTAERGNMGKISPSKRSPPGKGSPALYAPHDMQVYLATALLPTHSQASSSSPEDLTSESITPQVKLVLVAPRRQLHSKG